MSGREGNLRLCEPYQALMPPETAANDLMDPKRAVSRDTGISLSGDGQRRQLYTPFGGFSMIPFFVRPLGAVITPIRGYAALLAAAALGLAAVLLESGATVAAPLWAIFLLTGFALAAERQPVRITPQMELTVSAFPMLFAAVVYGPLAAMVVGALGLLGDFRAPHARWLVWTAGRALSGGLAGAAALLVLQEDGSVDRLLLAVALAVAVDAIIDAGVSSLTIAIRRSGSAIELLRQWVPIAILGIPLYVSVIALLAYAYSAVSPWSLVLFLAPAFAAQSLYRLYYQQKQAAEDLLGANLKLERVNISFASALVATLDARDRYTAGHSAAVAIYARDIATRLGLPESDCKLAHLAGLLHDIGKVGLPPGILEKNGPLTLEERRHMQKHSEIGERILANVEDYRHVAKIVRHHHERVDGEGYPDRLSGEAIPIISRIIAVADAYNAMTSGRPYRDAMASRVARLRLAQAVGTQFDTSVAAAFEAILATGTPSYLSGARADFALEIHQHPPAPRRVAAGVR